MNFVAASPRPVGRRRCRRWLPATKAVGLAVATLLTSAEPPIDNVVSRLGELASLDHRLRSVRFPSLPQTPPSDNLANASEAVDGRLRAEIIAAEVRAARQPTPANLHAWGIAQLLRGDDERAITTLERAYALSGGSPGIAGDLAAVQVARGLSADSPLEVATGLELLLLHSARAAPADAFNRALALETLGLRDQAAAAWQRCRLRDPSRDWASVAAARVRRLAVPVPPGSETAEREVLLHLLPAWFAGGAANGAPELERAAVVAATHAAAHHDPILVSVVAAAQAASGAQRRELVRGLQALAAARTAYDQHDLAACSNGARRAFGLLDRTHHQLLAMAALTGASCSYLGGRLDESARWAAKAHRLAFAQEPPSPLVLGQLAWLEGLIAYARARPAEAVEDYRRALVELARADDEQRAASVRNLLGGVYGYLGRSVAAWQEATAATRTAGLTPARRYQALQTLAALADDAGLPRVEREVAVAMSAEADRVLDPSYAADALAFQARAALGQGRREAAVSLWRRSLALAETIPEPYARARTAAYTRVELSAALPPELAAEAERLLAPVDSLAASDGELFLALALARARVRELLGDSAAAEDELRRAAARAREDRLSLASVASRDEAFSRRRDIYEALVGALVRRGKPEDALAVLEDWRTESFARVKLRDESRAQLTPNDGSVGVFSLLCLHQELYVWRLERGAISFARYAAPRERVAALAASFEAALRTGGDASLPGRQLARWIFGDPLSLPAKVVVVPDATLFAVPFAALPATRRGEPLLAAHEVAVTPSLRLWQSLRQSRTTQSRCTLLIGGAELGGVLYPNLQRLTRLDEELAQIGKRYACTDRANTRADVERQLAHEYAVVHFAGHAIA
ncbi:MAG TPA: CHAT domain-containing protein, partial [Thermoanaerobaculia bacterium]|nr:CHAT domain-containing protein [Thermoanaerobaculia bacterium]